VCQEQPKNCIKHTRQHLTLIGKLDCSNNRKIGGQLPVNETEETTMISTCLSLTCLGLKPDRINNKSLHIESVVRYKHSNKVMIEYF
jgi:hypothetical protein